MPRSTSSKSSRPPSTASSLMQDVPGSFPAIAQFGPEDNYDEEDQEPKTLHEVVHARRAEYVRPKNIRIKVGTWNTAAYKGAEKDVGGWFVQGRGMAEKLTGLNVSHGEAARSKEDVSEQEERYQYKEPTLPKGEEAALPGGDSVGLYVLGLQEVVDISSATEALRPYTDPSVATKWKDAMDAALPAGYRLVAEQQLIGLLLLVYAAPDVADDVKSVSTTSVGTGLMGYMGNKGAVTARIVLGDTTRLVFVNSHLAAGADKSSLERRNWDAQQIITRTKFEPIQDAMDLTQSQGEQIGDEDFAFWCGDLNYRLEGIPGDDVRRLLMLHTRNEYDLSQQAARKIEGELQEATNSVKERIKDSIGHENSSSSSSSSSDNRKSVDSMPPTTLVDEVAASEDPASLQTTLSSLLPHDELHQQMRARKAFHDGWKEGPITFLPTYKYDAGSVGVFDSSEKKRAPSWCDRILYRTRRDKLTYETTIKDEDKARKMDEQMKASGIDQAGNDDELLYDYDPEADGADAGGGDYDEYDEYDDAEDGVVITKEGFEDAISLEYYTAHQRVLSSDHKPLDASFMLKYDAVVPELKAKIHAEVARELDKAENEGRPNVTVVVDKHHDTPAASEECLPEKFEGVWFGDVRWAQSKHRSLTVANTSRVPTTFSFIERPAGPDEESGIAPRWLKIEVNGHEMSSSAKASEPITLEPGEAGNVDLELRILSMSDVHGLNEDKQDLEEILVLRVENGRDHFIPIRGRWLASSLGKSIDKLVRIPEGGIRKLQRQKPKDKLKRAAKTVEAAEILQKTTSKSSDDDENQDNPVRFSAPRELFRLTEAVEELSTRIIAEWEMVNAPATPATPLSPSIEPFGEQPPEPSAPWDTHPGWPFDEDCWTEKTTSHWTKALSALCNALDEDQPLESSLPEDLPRIQRLYVLCSFLLLFLKSMPDGVVTSTLWTDVERYMSENERSKRKPSNDDQRTAVQEILSQSPSHSISFVLVMGMLERIITERIINAAPVPGPRGHSRNPSTDSVQSQPLSPTRRAGGTIKRIMTGKTPTIPQGLSTREQATMAMAKIFADSVVRTGDVSGEKAKAALAKKKAEVLEIFLKREEVG